MYFEQDCGRNNYKPNIHKRTKGIPWIQELLFKHFFLNIFSIDNIAIF